MGYTHYWTNSSKKPTKKVQEEIKKWFANMVKHPECPPIEINWNDKTGIGFNGVGDDSHETMVISFEGNGEWNFCKTARKPYDKVVVACLIHCKNHGIIEKWSSDGNDDELKEGYNFFENSIKTALEVQ